MDRLHDACGVVGIYTPWCNQRTEIVQYLILALTALQHRGQESAGIAVYKSSGEIAHVVGMGKVHEVFADGGATLPVTYCGIGHVRYSTTGSSCIENAGPCVVGADQDKHKVIALAHNGNLANSADLRKQLPPELLHTMTDSEVLALMLHSAHGVTLRERMISIVPHLRGAYSLTILAEGKLYAMRDPWGMRPLCLGRLNNSWIVASESCALDRIGAAFVRSIEPGEFVTIDEDGVHVEILLQAQRQSLCVFEHIYFSDATSQLHGRSVYSVREAMGRALAREHPAEADLVVAVPETAIPAALGYAAEIGIPYGYAIIKNPYSDRTFIKPDQQQRQVALEQKFKLVKSAIAGARLIVIDDSIVRGTTMKHLVAALRRNGAKEIHLRSSAPPLRYPCHFGIDIPQEAELIASGRSMQEIATYFGVDSLGYLSLAGLSRSLQKKTAYTSDNGRNIDVLHAHFCYGCLEKSGWPFNPEETGELLQHVKTTR
ncbi:MAG: amidophosphoribosyltransferase [Ktedonobacteraceae bacterium]